MQGWPETGGHGYDRKRAGQGLFGSPACAGRLAVGRPQTTLAPLLSSYFHDRCLLRPGRQAAVKRRLIS